MCAVIFVLSHVSVVVVMFNWNVILYVFFSLPIIQSSILFFSLPCSTFLGLENLICFLFYIFLKTLALVSWSTTSPISLPAFGCLCAPEMSGTLLS